jgi:hypothetical protein
LVYFIQFWYVVSRKIVQPLIAVLYELLWNIWVQMVFKLIRPILHRTNGLKIFPWRDSNPDRQFPRQTRWSRHRSRLSFRSGNYIHTYIYYSWRGLL